MAIKLPNNLQGILWSVNIDNFDFKKNKDYVIHQVLAYGSWEHLFWLVNKYGLKEIRDTFVQIPAKDYTERTFNFTQKVLLNIPDNAIDKRFYVKTYPRIIR